MSMVVTNTEISKGCCMLKLKGEIDVSCASELRAAIFAEFEKEITSLSVDMSELSYIDSTGIGVFVGASHYAREHGISFKLYNLQKNVKRVFMLLGLDLQLDFGEADN